MAVQEDLFRGALTVIKFLMVPTSPDRLGDTGRRTGFWLEEYAAPTHVPDAAATVTLASPKGSRLRCPREATRPKGEHLLLGASKKVLLLRRPWPTQSGSAQ